MGELCQLDSTDFETVGGVAVFHIRKKVKTQFSTRMIPIHPTLKRIGLQKYVASLPSGARLFSDLEEHHGYLSEVPSARFSKLFSAIEIEGTFHSFRHSVTDALRNAGVPRDQINAIMGWSGKGMAETVYGSGLSVKILAKAVAKISYPGLSLDHLKK